MHSIEDGLAEDDWTGWQELYAELGDATIVLGDDLLCTNPNPHQTRGGVGLRQCPFAESQPNWDSQRSADALELARGYGWHVVVSGPHAVETEDDWLADLAVGWQADNIKVGSITQSERLAKYNRLLYLGNREPFGPEAGRLPDKGSFGPAAGCHGDKRIIARTVPVR